MPRTRRTPSKSKASAEEPAAAPASRSSRKRGAPKVVEEEVEDHADNDDNDDVDATATPTRGRRTKRQATSTVKAATTSAAKRKSPGRKTTAKATTSEKEPAASAKKETPAKKVASASATKRASRRGSTRSTAKVPAANESDDVDSEEDDETLSTKKSPAKKLPAKKTPAKKTPAKKSTTKKSAVKVDAADEAKMDDDAAGSSHVKTSSAKKSPVAKKSPAKQKAATKKSTAKLDTAAEKTMDEETGKLPEADAASRNKSAGNANKEDAAVVPSDKVSAGDKPGGRTRKASADGDADVTMEGDTTGAAQSIDIAAATDVSSIGLAITLARAAKATTTNDKVLSSSDAAVVKRVAQVSRHRERIDRAVDREVATTASFPIPTVANPSAVYEDSDARRRAQEKYDSQGAGGGEASESGSSSSNPFMNARKRKLIELRARMDKGRTSNYSAVMQEHRQRDSKVLRKDAKKEEWKHQEAARVAKMKAMGLDPANHRHMMATAEQVQAREAVKQHARDEFIAKRAPSFAQDRLYVTHDKRLASLPTVAGSAAAARITDAVEFGRAARADSSVGVDRMAGELREREQRKEANKLRRTEYVDNEVVTGINARNEKLNRVLDRAFDKYTVEIRQNLERGTAL